MLLFGLVLCTVLASEKKATRCPRALPQQHSNLGFHKETGSRRKLLLRVYLPRPVVGHRVAQATALPSGGGAEAPFGVVAVADQVL